MYHSYLRCDKVESADIFLLILYSFFLIFTAVLEPNQIVSDNWMRKTMAQLCSYNGKRHLPLPTGKYSVGACDLMTNETFMRLYYPHSDNPQSTFENSSLWLKWFPSLEYADGYLRFKFSRSIPLAARVLSWITGDPYCPIAKDVPVVKSDASLPIIVFSHGMGACRTTYSMFLTELASHGFFVAAVEHRDGSASATLTIKEGREEYLYDRKILPGEEEYPVRNSQVSTRIGECCSTLEVLKLLNEGEQVSDYCLKPSEDFITSVKGRLSTSLVGIAGHSFGGVTAIKATITKSNSSEFPFDYCIALDSWLYPIREEAKKLVKDFAGNSKMVFINCEVFQSVRNLQTMRNFEKPISSTLPSNVFTLRETIHYAPTDIPTIFMGSWAKYPFQWLFKRPPTKLDFPVDQAWSLTLKLSLSYLQSVIGLNANVIETIDEVTLKNQEYIIKGTFYKEDTDNEN